MFYQKYGERYAQFVTRYPHIRYLASSHDKLQSTEDLRVRLTGLVGKGTVGLDAGCGSACRDVIALYNSGYDMYGIDIDPNNIEVGKKLYPSLERRLREDDICGLVSCEDNFFNFVLCNVVIQHLSPDKVLGDALPELVRVLDYGGILQIMFKNGGGNLTPEYIYYKEDLVLTRLEELGMELVSGSKKKLGGVMYFMDYRWIEHCVFFMRKKNVS